MEKIYERYGESRNIPRCEDEAGLTQALVDGFEAWMRPEVQGSERVIIKLSSRDNLADVAGDLYNEEKELLTA